MREKKTSPGNDRVRVWVSACVWLCGSARVCDVTWVRAFDVMMSGKKMLHSRSDNVVVVDAVVHAGARSHSAPVQSQAVRTSPELTANTSHVCMRGRRGWITSPLPLFHSSKSPSAAPTHPPPTRDSRCFVMILRLLSVMSLVATNRSITTISLSPSLIISLSLPPSLFLSLSLSHYFSLSLSWSLIHL